MWKNFAGFVRMVIAINTERSYEVSVMPEVHFKVILIEPGVLVGYCIRRDTSFRCFLIFIRFVFWPRGTCHVFYWHAPQSPFSQQKIWGLPHCCSLIWLPSRSRRRGAPTTEPLGPPHDNLGLPSWSWPSTRNGPLDATPALSPKSSTAPATATL